MVTVELTPDEIHCLLVVLRRYFANAPKNGASVADMKAMLVRIEYLEGLK